MLVMKQINKGLYDLNLLRVFMTIWDTRNLTDAGDRLSLTQSAISHSLRRLRETFNDPLYVRASGGMMPTELATRLHKPLNQALLIIQHAVQESSDFNAASAQRIFRIAMSDVSEYFFLPALMRWLAHAAPAVHVKVVPLNPATVLQAMKAGEVDLAIGFIPQLESEEEEVASHYLFTDTFICLVRSGHPITKGRKTDIDLGSLGYVFGSTTAAGHQLAERWLTEIGVKRQIVLRLGHFTVAPSVVRESDLAVIFPASVAKLINADKAFALLNLPPGHPVIDIRLHVHAHFEGDAGIRWLRGTLMQLFPNGRHPSSSNLPIG